jgi:hypothetical protein
VRSTEHGPVRLQGDTGVERPGVDRVKSEPIDEPHDRGHRGGVITGRSHCEAIGRASRTPPLFELEVAEVVETLDDSGRREMLLHHNARALRGCCELFVDAVDLLPVVHGIDQDLARKEIVRNGAEAVHRHRQDDEAGVREDLVGRERVSAGGEHVHDQLDALRRRQRPPSSPPSTRRRVRRSAPRFDCSPHGSTLSTHSPVPVTLWRRLTRSCPHLAGPHVRLACDNATGEAT